MERSMELTELREAMDGTVAVREDEGAMRLLSWDDQSYRDSCLRCEGLLVQEWCYDLGNEGQHKARVFRCVQCGYRVDPVILKNQRRPTIDNLRLAGKDRGRGSWRNVTRTERQSDPTH